MNPPHAPPIKSLPKRSPFGSLFSRTLPAYSGQYPVGVRDVELPIRTQTFGTFKRRSVSDGEVGITLDTIMFTLFYPTALPTSHEGRVAWFPRLSKTVDGFMRMANCSSNPCYKLAIYTLAIITASGTTFPGIKNAPLKAPPGNKKWRVILFSHGAGCSRLMNTAVCGELASRGYIVAAIEHRDGTCPSVRITNERGEKKDLYWLNWLDLYWPDLVKQPTDDTTLRHVQLQVRLAEVEGVLQALRRLTRGDRLVSTGSVQSTGDWDNWHLIEMTQSIIAGHSFGGSLAIAAAADDRFNFSHVITFDPATQRLEPWKKHICVPLLAINSEEYTTGPEFTKLLSIAPSAVTHEVFFIPGSTHPSFSDVFLILPNHVNKWIGLAADPGHVIHWAVDTTLRFLEDEDIDAHHTMRCVGVYSKDRSIQPGCLVRCHWDEVLVDRAHTVPN